jgi:hypothetical protein
MMMEFPFTQGLTTLRARLGNYHPTIDFYRSLCTILRDEFLFKVKEFGGVDDRFDLLIIMEDNCSDIQIEWVEEIFCWYKSAGIGICVRRENEILHKH